MPKIKIALTDLAESITRPVVFDVLRRLFHDLGMDPKTLIYFPDSTGVGRQPGTSLDAKEDVAIMAHESQLTVEVDEVFEHSSLLANDVFRPEHPFVFKDTPLEVGIKPVFAHNEVTISFKYQARDKNEAIRWRNDFRGRIAMMRDEMLMDISYYWLFPNAFLKILEEIYELREATAPYGQSWEEYFDSHTPDRRTVVTNQSGKELRYSIAETQKKILGWFDVDGMPEEGSKEGDAENWTISVPYKFTFQKPIEAVMVYPLMIHNKMISTAVRSTVKPYRLENTPTRFSLSTEQFHHFEAGRDVVRFKTQPGVAIPDYDEWIPGSIVPGTQRLYTVLVGIDESNPLLLFNLNETGVLTFEPSVLTYLKAMYKDLNSPYSAFINVSLYQNQNLMNKRFLRIDEDLNVWATEELDLRKYYHVRVSAVRRISDLDLDAVDKAKDHGDAIIKIIDTTSPHVKDKCGLPVLGDRDYIGRLEMLRLSRCIDGDLISKGNKQAYPMVTVGGIFVEAHNART